MAFIRTQWTPQEADEWRKEDWIAIGLSVLAYICLTLGVALSLLLLPIGFFILGLGILFTVFMHLVIDPKLKTISEEYEKKQKEYILHLEQVNRWEVKS